MMKGGEIMIVNCIGIRKTAGAPDELVYITRISAKTIVDAMSTFVCEYVKEKYDDLFNSGIYEVWFDEVLDTE